MKITPGDLAHNYEKSKAAFGSAEVDEQEMEVIADLYEGNCKVSEIARVVRQKFDKNLFSQKIRNLIKKITTAEDDDSELLQTFLSKLKRIGVPFIIN